MALKESLLKTLELIQEDMTRDSLPWRALETMKTEVVKDSEIEDVNRSLTILYHKKRIMEEVLDESGRDITIKL